MREMRLGHRYGLEQTVESFKEKERKWSESKLSLDRNVAQRAEKFEEELNQFQARAEAGSVEDIDFIAYELRQNNMATDRTKMMARIGKVKNPSIYLINFLRECSTGHKIRIREKDGSEKYVRMLSDVEEHAVEVLGNSKHGCDMLYEMKKNGEGNLKEIDAILRALEKEAKERKANETH